MASGITLRCSTEIILSAPGWVKMNNFLLRSKPILKINSCFRFYPLVFVLHSIPFFMCDSKRAIRHYWSIDLYLTASTVRKLDYLNHPKAR